MLDLIIVFAEFPGLLYLAGVGDMCCLFFSVIDMCSRWLLVQFCAWIAPRGHHSSILAVTAAVSD